MPDFTARITEILGAHVDRQLTNYDTEREECGCGQQGSATYAAHVAALISQAAEQHYRPRIETVEQREALPAGVVVLDFRLNVFERLESWTDESDEPDGLIWGTVGIAAPVIPELPAVMLWSPGADE